MKRKHSNLDALIITHRNNELRLLQEKVELRDSLRLESEKTRKVECERQKLDIKLQEMVGEHRAAMTEIESRLREKEEKERALIKEREDDICRTKHEHEGKEGKLQAAMTDIESQLREKGKSEKRVRVESGEANENIERMKRDYELKLKEAKKRIDTPESKLRRISALLGAESDQTSEVGLETISGETGHRASMN